MSGGFRTTSTASIDEDLDVAGGRRCLSWWHRAAAHVADLQARLNQVGAQNSGLTDDRRRMAQKVQTHLNAAREALNRPGKWRAIVTGIWGSDSDRLTANMNEAEVELIRLVSDRELAALGPTILANGDQHLGKTDARLIRLRKIMRDTASIPQDSRELAAETLHAALVADEEERRRARNFRNILTVAAFMMSIVAIGFIVWGYLDPNQLGSVLCFTPNDVRVCPVPAPANLTGTPTGSDVVAVEVFGAAAAAFAGAVSLRKMQGTSTPYAIPVMLLLLRIPVGALSALLGLTLIHGGFVPGLSDLDNGPQIVAWAVLFGVAQESVTRLIDRQGRAVLSNVHGSERAFQTAGNLELDGQDATGPPAQPAAPD